MRAVTCAIVAFWVMGSSGGCAPARTRKAPAGRIAVASPVPSPIPTPTPTPSPVRPIRLDREVLFNEVTHGDDAPTRERGNCRMILGGWTFGESGAQVWMGRSSDGWVTGVPPPESPHESATGTWSGDEIHLAGRSHVQVDGVWRDAPVGYDLRVEAGTGHLVGTRNGAPIHLAPTVIQGPDCSHEPPVP